MGRKRSEKNKDLPDNLYVRNSGYYCYRNPKTREEFGLGRNRKHAILEAKQTNLLLDYKEKPSIIDRINNIASKKDNPTLMIEWLDRYKEIMLNKNLSAKTIVDYTSRISAISTHFKDVNIEDITTRNAADFILTYTKQGKNTRAKKVRETLIDIFNEAIRDGVVSNNPVTVTRKPKVTVNRERLMLEHFNTILQVTREKYSMLMALYFEFSLLIGQRVSDVADLEYGYITDDKIYFTQHKTGTALAISLDLGLDIIGKSIRDVLEEIKLASGYSTGFIIRNKNGRKISSNRLSCIFTEMRNLSGIVFKKSPTTFHEIRSLAARLYAAENNEAKAQDVLGHKSLNTTKIYLDERDEEKYKIVTK